MARATRLWVKLKIHRCNSCISWAMIHSQTSLLPVLDRLANPTLIQRQAALLVQPVGLVADYLHPAALVLLGHIEQGVVNLVIEIDSSGGRRSYLKTAGLNNQSASAFGFGLNPPAVAEVM